MRVEQQKTEVAMQLWQGIENTGDKGSSAIGNVAAGNTKVSGAADGVTRAGSAVSVNMKDVTYLKPQSEEKDDISKEIEQSGEMSARDKKNQMAVLANTTSAEDYEKMQEDGFSLDSSTGTTIVTETDKIKAVLAKAGVDISMFGDDLSTEQLEEITGSPELAAQIETAIKKADLPTTDENLKDTADALQVAETLAPLSDGAMRYLLSNGVEPTIENIYLASHSGDIRYMPQSEEIDFSGMESQLMSVIEQTGYEVNDDAVIDAKWLIENDIALTPENFAYYEELKSLTLPLETDSVLSAITTAISKGGRPLDAVISVGDSVSLNADSMIDEARHAVDVINEATTEDIDFLSENDMVLNIKNLVYAKIERSQKTGTEVLAAGDGESFSDEIGWDRDESRSITDSAGNTPTAEQLTAYRQLEETRLMMTVEASYAMLKRGISIDTEPLEKLVAELKDQEQQYYGNLLKAQGIDATDENVSLFKQTMNEVNDIKYVPAYVLGIKNADVSTIGGLHEAGAVLKDTFDKANRAYETLMTAPRADLGDDIDKAFRNVDDILDGLGMDINNENERAVRILAYNETEINPDTIAQMKLADEQVQRVFKQMTPAVVTEMIREDINPLDLNIATLEKVSAHLSGGLGQSDSRKFGEFLWKMEQNKEIGADERESYIGIYRLIHQVEESDGAAIGSLVNEGAPITMRNLMMAVRTEKKSGKIDYSVDDDFGEIKGSLASSITDQIETAYQNGCIKDVADMLTPEKLKNVLGSGDEWQDMTPEQLKDALAGVWTDETETDREYAAMQLEALSECADASEDIYSLLERYDIPETVSYILAAQTMSKNRNQAFRKLFTEMSDSEKDDVTQEFLDALSSPDELDAAEEHLKEKAQKEMQEKFMQDDVTSIDINEMRRMSAQIDITRYMAREERYSVPLMVSDGVINVSLKVVRGTDEKGIVDITMESDDHGRIAATFNANDKGISGTIMTDDSDTESMLYENIEEITEHITNDGEVYLKVACIDDMDLDHFTGDVNDNSTGIGGEDNKPAAVAEKNPVQTARLYRIAEGFIRDMQELLSA